MHPLPTVINKNLTPAIPPRHSSRIINSWILLVLVLIPLSCSAQKNTLKYVSSAERSDNRGHVVRFHLDEETSSINFSQPQAYLVQLELLGNGITTKDIRMAVQRQIFKQVDFYAIEGGIGVDIFLTNDTFFKADAYPDAGTDDILVGLTKTSGQDLANYIKSMQPFGWSDAAIPATPLTAEGEAENNTAAIDTSYQKVKDKIKFDTVVLDAGHGGRDVGAIGHRRTYEKNIVFDITKKVGEYINKYLPDVKVVYTRDDDYLVGVKKNQNVTILESLKERGRIANRADGDLFVSIHANSAGANQAHGTETYFLGLERSQTALEVMKRENNVVSDDDESTGNKLSQEDLIIYELANSGYIANSERLAALVQDQFKNRAQRRSRGVKQARFVVLYHASMPAILIETGFITNPSEAEYLKSNYGQSIIASAIFRAIRNYKEQFEKSQHFNPTPQQ
jgi:N-acetylmuramoyl-L-alanine amidase